MSVARGFVAEFFERTVLNPDVVGHIAVTAHELLENAAKYSSDGQTRIRIEVDERGTAEICVSNRTTPDRLRELERCYREVVAAPDAVAHYVELMRWTARRKEGSGLGLARISAETGMALDMVVKDGVVEMRARTQVRPEAT